MLAVESSRYPANKPTSRSRPPAQQQNSAVTTATTTTTTTSILTASNNAFLSCNFQDFSSLGLAGQQPLTEDQIARQQAFRRNIASIAKLKSPERKILYNEWFTIIKRMERDPKFDLEALVRTRGRFTEHDHISYRDRLISKQQQQSGGGTNSNRLRCARSEPNFTSMMYLTSTSGDHNHHHRQIIYHRNLNYIYID